MLPLVPVYRLAQFLDNISALVRRFSIGAPHLRTVCAAPYTLSISLSIVYLRTVCAALYT